MSVALMIDNPRTDAEDRRYVPVATERTFEDEWQNAAKQLELEWVQHFQFGIVFGYEQGPAIIQELEKVKEWFLTTIADQEKAQWLGLRVDQVIKAIEEIFTEKELRIFIG